MSEESKTFTIGNKTFTVGEKRLCCGDVVEVVGQFVGANPYVVFRRDDGRVDYAHHSYFDPIPEPTIEVPVSVAKAMNRHVNYAKAGKGHEALEAFRRLLKEAGHR